MSPPDVARMAPGRLTYLSWRARVWEAMPEQAGAACIQGLVKNAVRADCVEPHVPVGWDTMAG